jgi:branched-chain amino acid transport system substrate-binding protein
MGGDALLGGQFLTDLGALGAAGDLAVYPGAPATSLPTAREYVRRFQAAGFGPDPGPYGATAYDATRAIIRAFAASVGDATTIDAAVRSGVVEQLDVIRFEGATGPISFDRFGDAEERPLAVYEVVGRGWDVSGVVRVG